MRGALSSRRVSASTQRPASRLVFILVVLLGLSGCASSQSAATGTVDPVPTATEATDEPAPIAVRPNVNIEHRSDRVASVVAERHRDWAKEVILTDWDALGTGDYANNPKVEAFIDRMVSQGFDRAALVRLFSLVERDDSILELMNRQWEPSPLPSPNGAWLRYRGRHIGPAMLTKGDAFWSTHAPALQLASQRYGVEPEYIVAIIGIETRWGGYIGTHRVIDALATLAFDYPRRSAFFTDELEQYLIMARDEGIDPRQPEGSYAGAMGLGQFMPSSFHAYAVDLDADGQRNLWDVDDAIGSVANYFAAHGWQWGAPVAIPARGGDTLSQQVETGLNTSYRIADLRERGLRPKGSLADTDRVSLIRLDVGDSYDYWLGLDNFNVITRYNRSSHYAMAVHQLAQALRERRQGESEPRLTDLPVSAATPDRPASG